MTLVSERPSPPPDDGKRAASAARGEDVFVLGGLVALLAITAAWWALALWPVADAPVWLQRTRAACFGVAASGLPDAGGWIGLIAGPLGMGAVLLAGWGDSLRRLRRRARRSRPLATAFALLALVTGTLLTGAGLRIHQARSASFDPRSPSAAGPELPPESYPRQDRPAPRLALTAQDGRAFDLAALRGRPVLVTFAYAHCQTVCPVIVKQTLEAQATLATSGIPVGVVILTLDPWRDTPSRLPALAAAWSLPARDAWILSGGVAEVQAALDEWQVPRDRNGSSGEVTHPALVYVVDDTGRIAFAANGGADALVTLVRRL